MHIEDIRRDLTIAVLCTGGLALLLAPASVITLGLGVLVGYRGQHYIDTWLKEGKGK